MATEPATPSPGSPGAPAPQGLARLIGATRYSLLGLRHAARHEAAFRQEVLALALLTPAAVLLPVPRVERLILLLSMMGVVVVELLNSAIESTVDRISAERHPLSGQAKDMGSAAVLVAVAMSCLAWCVIAGPVLVGWLAALSPSLSTVR